MYKLWYKIISTCSKETALKSISSEQKKPDIRTVMNYNCLYKA